MISDNMWETHQMQAYLADEYGDGAAYSDPWTSTVVPQIKEAVINSVLSSQEWLEHRDNSHALLGYDLMVDEDLSVWLIEVNVSPAMDFSTPITKKLVTQLMSEELPRILLDGDNGRRPLDGEDRTGNWERIYN